jgi:arylsulfatase A-like enzyme
VAVALFVAGCAGPSRPNVLIVLIDTLRADRLGVYGNDRGLTPFLDTLASQGTLFERAYAPSCWTVPSVSSLFTSRYPSQHHMVTFTSRLPESEVTLAERLRDAGWITGGFVANPNLQPEFGYGQGFDEWRVAPSEDPHMTDGDRVRAQALEWLDRAWHPDSNQPVFLYVHYMEPHAPYEPREPFRHRFVVDEGGRPFDSKATGDAFWDDLAPRWLAEPDPPTASPARALELFLALSGAGGELSNRLACLTPEDDGFALLADRIRHRLAFGSSRLYDAEVAGVDEQVRLLFDELGRRRFFRHAVTVVTADHGEEFMEHGGVGHARALYEESVHVPLIMTGRGSAKARVSANVSLVDVAPTILELLQMPAEPAFEGHSLTAGGARDVVLEFEPIFQNAANVREHALGLVRARRKLLVAPSGHATTYDLDLDPGEDHGDATNTSAAMAEALAAAEERLATRAGTSAPIQPVDAAVAHRLKALGYTR